jgi:glutamyl-tRNA reductase
MPILALGVSYRRATVELLERLSFGPDEWPKAYQRLREGGSLTEGVVLSTCNRVEVYANVTSYHAGFQDVKRFLAESREVAPEEFAEPLYAHYETDAAEHLFDVAAGIDSVVVGEPQILTQVRGAYRIAQEEGSLGPVLSALFRGAIRTGRRARTETGIGASAAAYVEAGLAAGEAFLGPLADRRAVVVGAGAMATLAVAGLRAAGVRVTRIVNRTIDRGRRLAERAGAEAVSFDRLAGALSQADLVVSSTAAPGVVIGLPEVGGAGADRRDRPLFVLDLAVPRDVDHSVRSVPGIGVADLDDLKGMLTPAGEAAAAEVARVRAIVAAEVERFESWRRAARLAPLIQELRAMGQRIQAAELARAAPRLAGLTDGELATVEGLVRSVVAKLLHEPIVRLKDRSGPGAPDEQARVLAELFGLSFVPSR